MPLSIIVVLFHTQKIKFNHKTISMREATPPLPHTPSWRGAQLKKILGITLRYFSSETAVAMVTKVSSFNLTLRDSSLR
jgi:hypothetical protein